MGVLGVVCGERDIVVSTVGTVTLGCYGGIGGWVGERDIVVSTVGTMT